MSKNLRLARAAPTGGRRRGPKKGTKHTAYPQSAWYQLCIAYEKLQQQEEAAQLHASAGMDDGGDEQEEHNNNNSCNSKKEKTTPSKRGKTSQMEFLRRQTIVPDISDGHSVTFNRNWKKYQKGELQNTSRIRSNRPKYQNIENRLVDYLNWQTQLGQCESQTWEVLQEKCREWAQELGYGDRFRASPGWLAATLKRHNQLKKGQNASMVEDSDDDDNDDDDECGNNPDDEMNAFPLSGTMQQQQSHAGIPNHNPQTHHAHIPDNSWWGNNPQNISVIPGCMSCPQWQQTCKLLEQQKNAALAKVRILEQEKQKAQKAMRALEKKHKLAENEIKKLKGVIKVSLKID